MTAYYLRSTILILAIVLSAFFATAQKVTFEFFTTADGLTGNFTSPVTQDDQGFLWFLNDGLLHRNDGRNFVVYPIPEALSANQERLSGVVSWQDSLLFVWSEHSPFLFNPKSGKWQSIKLPENINKSDGTRIWQGAGNTFMARVRTGYGVPGFSTDKTSGFKRPHLSKYTQLVNSYHWDGASAFDFHLVYSDTLYQLGQSGQLKKVTLLDNICKNCGDISFQTTPDGTVVLMENGRFYRLDRSTNKFIPHAANRFLKGNEGYLLRFIVEKNGSIWASGHDRSLLYYDASKDTLYDFHNELKKLLPNRDDFMGLFQDRTGIVWINTRLGLLKVRPHTNPFDTYFTGLGPSNTYYSFRGLTEDAHGMVYGVYYVGVAKFDPAKKQPQRTYSFKGVPNLFDLSADGDKIWLNGGQLFDPKTGIVGNMPSLFHTSPYSDNGFFAKDKSGTLWWASHYFLYRLDKSPTGNQWIRELELPGKILNKTEAFHVGTRSGKLWLSYNGKLLEYSPETRKQRWFKPRDAGLPFARILTIEENDQGKLWLGTDAGLLYVDPASGARKQYTVNDGLPNNFISGMLSDPDSCLWLSTNHGLSRFHIPSETFINFLEEDGLTYNEFNRKSYFKARNGRMFFGGMRGVNAFFPKEVMHSYRNKDQGSKLVLTSIEYTDERRDSVLRKTNFATRPEIRLHDWDWSYTFEYALTDYNNPKEIVYSYKMEGYKDSWSVPSQFNFTKFNSLPSGEYTFRVKARDNRGRWHPNELAVKIIVYPPWWATWWAYAIYVLLFAAVGFAIYSFLKKRLLLRSELKLEQQEALRLKELDQFKSRLYTNLTHEFRTPLTVILGMVGQVRSQPDKYLEEGTRLIETNGENLLRLINQLLDLSKLENKSFQLHLQQGDIVPYLRYVTESFKSYADGQGVSLGFATTIACLRMDYDPEQVKQVLANLISNAIKFTPSGGDVIVCLAGDVNQLILEVRDTGIGIGSSDLPHVFDRFYQVDDTYTRKGEGTGIGLAHAQELVKLMNGEISVKSERGKGTTFLVRLPVSNTAPEVEGSLIKRTDQLSLIQNGVAAFETLASTLHSSGLPQLLIIEDNPDVVIYLKTCLDGLYQLDVAYNGLIGIDKALKNIPDLIISDVMMPEKDGYEVCDTLKNDERTSHIPIILLTAKAGTTAKIAGLKRGADAYLTKPFNKEELLVRIQMLVERQKRLIAHFSKINLLDAPVTVPAREAVFIMEDTFIQKVREIVAKNFADENFALPQLCMEIGMSRSQLFRKMKAVMDTSPSDFIRSYRLAKARFLLETTPLTVSEVAWQTGYKNPGHFSTSFQEAFGVSPSSLAK